MRIAPRSGRVPSRNRTCRFRVRFAGWHTVFQLRLERTEADQVRLCFRASAQSTAKAGVLVYRELLRVAQAFRYELGTITQYRCACTVSESPALERNGVSTRIDQ